MQVRTAVLALAVAAGALTAATVGSAPAGRATTDPTGSPAALSVPDTAYLVPAGAVFLSTTGSDTATGSAASPYRTLGRALAAVPAGGTVVARGGTYRDGAASTYKAFTLQAYPHEQVWFDGTDVVTGWTPSSAGVWTRAWSTPSFCAGQYYAAPYRQQSGSGPCTHADMAGDPGNPAAGDPQMVFVDGAPLRESTTLAGVAGGFYYDQAARRVYLGTDPTGHRVEMAARASALVLQGGSGATVRGVGFRRYATNEFNGNATHGAVLGGEPDLVFDHDAFTEQAGAGLSITDPRGGVVRSSLFVRNGFNGLDANGHQHSTGASDGFSLLDSTFDGNNTELFGTGCSASCAAAASKMTHMDGLTVSGNVFAGTHGNGKGFWCDLACSRATIVDNTVTGNGNTGLYYEVSDSALIASNLITHNGAYGLKVGAAHTRIVNNTLAGNGATAVLVYDDNRSPGVGGWSDVGPDTTQVSLLNNVVSGGSVSFWRTSSTAPNTGPNTFVAGMDSDSSYRSSAGTLVDWRDGTTTSYPTLAALHTARGLEAHGQDLLGGSDPFFVDAAGGDYRVRSTSVAHATGAPLPADVAAAIGVPTGVAVDRGALVHPGRSAPAPSPTPTPTPTLSPTPTPAGPVITSVSPADGATVSGTTSLTMRATGAASAQLYLGSSLAHSFTGPGPYSFGFDSTRLAAGTVVHITWKATDSAGRTTQVEEHVAVHG